MATRDTAYRTIDQDMQIVATWSGGMYIELFWGHNLQEPFEVINVYDYRAGRIEENVNVSKELTKWISSTGKAEIRNYYRHTA